MGCTNIIRLAQIKQLHGCNQTLLSSVNSLNVLNEVIYVSDYPTNSPFVTSCFIDYIYFLN